MAYKLYTAEQVGGIDAAAIHELDISAYALMCRAGKAVIDEVCKHFPATGHWLILCGPGNNGGDGYVVARLAQAAGVRVSVCSLVDPQRLKGEAAMACADWQKAGGKLRPWPLPEDNGFDLALDALLGTGIDREVEGKFRQAIDYLNQLECPVFAIDIPSGLNADTGCVMGCAVQARHSITFVGRKRGMYTADGPDYCGHITFDDLDIPAEAAKQYTSDAGRLLTSDFLAGKLKPRLRNTHKGSFAHVLAVGGIEGMSGAIRLCGEAALRSGAGRVTLVTAAAHAGLINLARPELMVKAIDADSQWLASLSGNHVLAVGPGLGTTAWSESLFMACLGLQCALVVDADGLNLLALQNRQNMKGRDHLRRDHWILTPHPAEAARLLSCKVADIQQDRVRAATTIAQRFAACVVLKGCGTIVAAPGGEYAICPYGNPGMATAGSGDVLTGVITALLGQGLSCFDAACVGVQAHARAGDLAAENTGQMALIASNIIDHLPRVWRAAGL
jgi:NAD(P)H-hydrate epimerase